MIDVRFGSGRRDGGEGLVESFFGVVETDLHNDLAPVHGSVAGHEEAEVAGGLAVLVEVDVAGAGDGVGGVGLHGRDGEAAASGGLAEAAGAGVLPTDDLEGAHFFAGVEVDLLAGEGEDDDVVVELIDVEVAGGEDAAVTIDDFHVVGSEAGGAEHGEIEQGYVLTGAALLRPGVFGALGFMQSENLELRFAFFAGEVSVIESLDGFIEFFGFDDVGVAGGDDAGYGLFDGVGGLGEVIHVFGPIFGFGLPVVGAAEGTDVVEVHLVQKAVDGRHPFFVGSGRDVGYVECYVAGGIVFELNSGREDGPPEHRVDLVSMLIGQIHAGLAGRAFLERGKRREGVMGLVNEVVFLELPERGGKVFVVVADVVAVLEDASNLHTGQCEDLARELGVAGFGDQQVFRLYFKGDYGSVGVYGAALDVGDLAVAADIGKLDGGELLALFLEHFDSGVVALIVKRVVGDFLEVEIDGGGAGGFGVVGHLELVGGGLMELSAEKGGCSKHEKQEYRQGKAMDSHGIFLCF